jgi:hypothetical protein
MCFVAPRACAASGHKANAQHNRLTGGAVKRPANPFEIRIGNLPGRGFGAGEDD